MKDISPRNGLKRGTVFIILFLSAAVYGPFIAGAQEEPEVPDTEAMREFLESQEAAGLPPEMLEDLRRALNEENLEAPEDAGVAEEEAEESYGEELIPGVEGQMPQNPPRRLPFQQRGPNATGKTPSPSAAPALPAPSGTATGSPRAVKSGMQGAAAEAVGLTASAQGSDKISLDLKGVDIIDVLKMFSSRSGFNIVAGKNVRGKVTLFLKDVDVWDAFNIIMASNDLAYEKRGNIINVMTDRDYERIYGRKFDAKETMRIIQLEYAKAADVSKALNQSKSKVGKVIIDEASNTLILVDIPPVLEEMEQMVAKMDMPTETRIFNLNYAKAEDVKTKISERLTPNVGTAQVDERTNKVVIKDLAKRMDELARIVAALDEKHKQVLIEAKIVEISLTNEFQYGVDWGMVLENINSNVAFSFSDLGDVALGSVTGGGLTLKSLTYSGLDGAVRALSVLGKTNVISSPRIMVLNNEEAKVLVGTNQPYITSTTTVPDSGSPVTSEAVTYLDLGISLTVTPTINNDGFVTMRIKPEISSKTGEVETAKSSTTASGNKIPIVTKSETETTVMVQDGTTILIAGLIQDRDVESESKVPILGDIPLIGKIFKKQSSGSTGTSSNDPEKKELIVFLTPFIVGGSEMFPAVENVQLAKSLSPEHKRSLEDVISLTVEDLERKELAGDLPDDLPEDDGSTRLAGSKKDKELEAMLTESKERKAASERRKPKMAVPSADYFRFKETGYYSYYENVRNKILWEAGRLRVYSKSKEKGDVDVTFVVTSAGKLKGNPSVSNEVSKELAGAAIEAVKQSAPFQPFPNTMFKPEEKFRVTIAYE